MSGQPVKPVSALSPARALSHPAWIAALGLLVLNDHFLKGSGILPGWLTGKLSDFSGMLVAPALLALLSQVRTRRGLVLVHVVVGAGFAGLELSAALTALAARAYEAMGLHWRSWSDPSDLLALAFLPLSYVLVIRAQASRSALGAPRSLAPVRSGFAVAGMLACVATSDDSQMPPQTCDESTYDCDADGWGLPEDCNDFDASLTPGMGCPPVWAEEICDDGIDDDSDGLVDCLDQDCVFVCFDLQTECQSTGPMDPTTLDELSGTTIGGSSLTDGSCIGSDAPEVIFQLQPTRSGVLELTVPDGHGLHLRAFCSAAHTETQCFTPDEVGTKVSVTLASGEPLTIVVEAEDALLAGPFTIPVAFRSGGCGDGLWTSDEGCDDGNTLDGDGCSGVCEVEVPSLCSGATTLPVGSTDATFEVATFAVASDCASSFNAAERLFTFVAPSTGTLLLSATSSVDLVLSAYGDCAIDQPSLACSNDAGASGIESLALAVTSGDTLTIMVEQLSGTDPAVTFTLSATMQ